MEKLIETVELLRTKYKFRGYIHLKAIPGADKSLIDRAAAFADRMSLNIELPSEGSLKLLAPQKKKDAILLPMRQLAETYIHDQLEKPRAKKIPAGQTTQMIIGASPDTDARILRLSQGLYDNFRLKRVYYSSYVPVNTDNSLLPMVPSDLRREHRLYEADFLIRLYGFKAEELLPADTNLSLDIDVKSDWALNNYGLFPLEINKASYEMLLRVPGIGVRNAYRIAEARRHGKITFESLKKMRVVLKRAKYFITADGKFYGDNENPERIRNILKGHNLLKPSVKSTQLSFFDTLPSYITGEL